MSWLGVVSAVLVWVGVVVAVGCSVGVALAKDVFDRLHMLAGLTTLGVPVVVVGLAAGASDWRSAVKLLIIAALVLGVGPVTTAATGQAATRAADGDRHGSV
ncbi:MAG: monovalent cation/H(+) antiporter subunit G [Nocardioidaceae bacterium]